MPVMNPNNSIMGFDFGKGESKQRTACFPSLVGGTFAESTDTKITKLEEKVDKLTDKIDSLSRKIDLIFGDQILMGGRFIHLKQNGQS